MGRSRRETTHLKSHFSTQFSRKRRGDLEVWATVSSRGGCVLASAPLPIIAQDLTRSLRPEREARLRFNPRR